MDIVRLINVRKRVGREIVLDGVDLAVSPREIVLIRGRSGVGKTTLAKILALIHPPDSGEVLFLGENITSSSDGVRSMIRLKHIGYIDQHFKLIPSLTVLENVELPLRLMGAPRDKRRREAVNLLSRLGLEEKLHKYPHELSGGERQRVAIARALVKKPKLIVGDEPLSNLDDHTANKVMSILDEYIAENNGGVVITTTDLYRRIPNISRDLALVNGRLH